MAQKIDQARLLKIGKEAFALLEEHDRTRKGRPNTTPARRPPAAVSPPEPRNCNYRYQPTKPLVYQVNPAPATHEEVIMNSYDTMIVHDGLLVMDYSKKKSTAMAY